MSNQAIEGTAQERRLYDLIWKRTAASQMADAQIEKTQVTIEVKGTTPQPAFSNGDDDNNQEEFAHTLPVMTVGEALQRREIVATERFSQGPMRYTEASLVHKLEELGIGRPSTYAPTISTIQQREYVQKGDKKGEERPYSVFTLKGIKVTKSTRKEMVGSEKGKLLPTDIGIVVNDFLQKNFPGIMDYNFTARVEQEFDKIAEGGEEWKKMMKDFYGNFEPTVEKAMKKREDHKAGERELGISCLQTRA